MLPNIINRVGSNFALKRWIQNHQILKRYGSNSAAYDGDGKTTVRILNADESHLNLVNTYSSRGFRLANNLFITGSMLLFPTHVFSWNVKRGIDITPESLIVFDLIVPKTKIIIIGYGQKGEPYNAAIPMILKKKGISCEMLPTPSAVTTYNYLVSDSTHVAGAFIPVKELVFATERDIQPYNQDYYTGGDYFNNAKKLNEETAEEDEFIEKQREWEKKHVDPDKKTFDP